MLEEKKNELDDGYLCSLDLNFSYHYVLMHLQFDQEKENYQVLVLFGLKFILPLGFI
jgi:hypothetical protein